VLGTVKGDVHDIGKNLVDIILTNNGYTVHNMGIKVPITEMIEKALEVKADAIGMSGLLVKSTLIMRDNLLELASRDLERIPVMLGGAALTRAYVERDLRENYPAGCSTARTPSRACTRWTASAKIKAEGETDEDKGWGIEPSEIPGLSARLAQGPAKAPSAHRPARPLPRGGHRQPGVRPAVPRHRVVKGIPIDDIAGWVNETALYRNQWQFRPEGGEDDAAFKERVRNRFRASNWPTPANRTCSSRRSSTATSRPTATARPGDLDRREPQRRASPASRFPAQTKSPYLCIADFFRSVESGEPDYVAAQIATMGSKVSERTAELFAADKYTEYLFLHGLGVEMAESLAERGTAASARSGASPTRIRAGQTPDRTGPVPPEVPRRPLLASATPPAPTWRTTPSVSCSAPRRSASSATRTPAGSTTRADHQRPSSATTPKAKYFVARSMHNTSDRVKGLWNSASYSP
jgi:5-methyltetrahydrofolate--homocysteine methyltransferase